MLRFDALLYPQDGFVLVGSVAGQRYWSTVLNQESIITTGTWTPDDQQVFFYYFFLNLFRKLILKCLAKNKMATGLSGNVEWINRCLGRA